MPEGPELHLSSLFINSVCRGRIFGRAVKSDISKNPEIKPPADKFTITASSRGKEIKLTLTSYGSAQTTDRHLDVLFTFGLAGKFEFYKSSELKKHAHMCFFTHDDEEEMVLSFNDYMRFGKWMPGADFTYKERGPCVLYDYQAFRDHVLKNLHQSTFNKPICEVLLNQKYFNGIGNYLRAEILYRARVPPFVSARSVLEPLGNSITVKSETPDLLQLCNQLPLEVVQLEGSWYDGDKRGDDSNGFNNWLQCYYQEGMKNAVDHNKRTIWYTGPLGPLAPKDGVTRGKKKSKSKNMNEQTDTGVSIEKIKKEGVLDEKITRKRKKKNTVGETCTIPKPASEKVKHDRVTRSKVAKTKKEKTENKKEENKTESKVRTTSQRGKQLKEPIREKTSMQIDNKDAIKQNKVDDDTNSFESVLKLDGFKTTNVSKVGRKRKLPLTNGAPYLNSSGKKEKTKLATPKRPRQSRSKR